MCEPMHMLTIPKSTIFHRKAFHYATRSWDETLESWYGRLRTLAEQCLFGDLLEVFLLNKFAVELKDEFDDVFDAVIDVNQHSWKFESMDTVICFTRLDVERKGLMATECIKQEPTGDNQNFMLVDEQEAEENCSVPCSPAYADDNEGISTLLAPTEAEPMVIMDSKTDGQYFESKKRRATRKLKENEPKVKRKRDFRGEYYCEQCPGKLFIYKCEC